MIANNLIDRNTNRKRPALIHNVAVYFFVVQLARLCFDDGRSELTQVNDFSTSNTLGYEARECQIDNFGRFLIFRAYVTGYKVAFTGLDGNMVLGVCVCVYVFVCEWHCVFTSNRACPSE